jgi:hypothetical protein
VFVLLLLTARTALPLEAAVSRELSAGSVEEGREPKIDGLVTDDAWLAVEPYKGFTQQNPIEGAPASEETEVRVLLGGTTLYIGVIAFDSEPDKILVTESRRDAELNETDSIQIVLDTFNDNQNAFLFGTNPIGLEYDGQVAAEGRRRVSTAGTGDRSAARQRVQLELTVTGRSARRSPSAVRRRWRFRSTLHRAGREPHLGLQRGENIRQERQVFSPDAPEGASTGSRSRQDH